MRKTKSFFAGLMSLLIIVSMTGCSVLTMKRILNRFDDLKSKISNVISGSDVSVSDTDKPSERIEIIIDALDKKDAEQFKSVFSQTTLRIADDMDKGIEYIFGLYEGEYSRTIYRNYSSTKHYRAKNTTLVNAVYVIQTNADKYYRINYSVWTVQEEYPESVGIYSLDFSECDKDQKGGGGGPWLAGISYPEREGVEAVAAGIADTMITGKEKYLRQVLSDELLAAEGIERKITAFTKDYSKINPSTVGDSWVRVREDGKFGYLVINSHPITFIVFEMSEEQPDKMSAMKVTIVNDNDELPEYGIEPAGVGLFFPKFLHKK